MRRGYSVWHILNFKPSTLDFTGRWRNLIGCPEVTGSWIIWGKSANGKTRFALQLASYLCNFGKVAYNSLEEGLSLTMQNAIKEVGFTSMECKRNFMLLDKEPLDDLRLRLQSRGAPRAVIIDSLQYTGLNYDDYKELRNENPDKILIFISHADGVEPKGNVANSVKFDANVKIYVEGYRAMAQSRYGGGTHFDIWPLKASEYWGN